MKKKTKTHQKGRQTDKKNIKPENKLLKIIVLNIAMLIVSGLILNYYMGRTEIKWIHTMLTSNYKIITQNPKATFDERLSMKLGFNYMYLNSVCRNTPDTAVILFPKRDVFLKQPTNFTDAEFGRIWISNFVYPRKAVIDEDTTGINRPITHVAIVNGWGYDKLNYQVSGSRPENTVLPVNRQN
ncbi:MAG: hypothetical protein LBQ70_03175 [Prevotellaceae bacterium]|nr:hypothetical protein [Prevotellaceae bacterium]